MLEDHWQMLIRLAAALAAGSLIGLERSIHGHPAGFRTHALVSLASGLLMLVTAYQARWFPELPEESLRIDPARMAQGIMTGIGFLGAGAIIKVGFNIQGLTTAASIWTTAAIGILMGIGAFAPGWASVALTLGVLTLFNLIEQRIPSLIHVHQTVRFARDAVMPEADLKRLCDRCGISAQMLGYALIDDGRTYEYRMLIRTLNPDALARLAEALKASPSVIGFFVSPIVNGPSDGN
ncbi:MAG TPA: MgtC/SapB family protein [Azospirillaceae bacterium]|nr:MgtC/SapB family protein [Azospirillaceae bacterium]